eukprot:m.11665 g.11665  ORF g.11665 m.11665 type:complete len:102 (-) comp6612_c1_seq1:1521-1826(-)
MTLLSSFIMEIQLLLFPHYQAVDKLHLLLARRCLFPHLATFTVIAKLYLLSRSALLIHPFNHQLDRYFGSLGAIFPCLTSLLFGASYCVSTCSNSISDLEF